jgi:hypothetical protein
VRAVSLVVKLPVVSCISIPLKHSCYIGIKKALVFGIVPLVEQSCRRVASVVTVVPGLIADHIVCY